MSREIISTELAPAAIGPYSQGIRANGMVYVSGQGGLVPGSKQFVGETVAEQTAQTLRNIQAILEAGGSDLAHVVKVTVLLADIETFAEMNEVYAEYFTVNPPGRTTVGVSALPAGAQVEITVTALE